ncbi:serine hydrolase domain-containing protein [Streptomyces sp. NPDC046821]|uniref:serine hydrolase domain-containing protein n=1 Tax=Streptomyces sp. NPDC046821 TaxID=3154702 RepID=UPI0033DCB1AE
MLAPQRTRRPRPGRRLSLAALAVAALVGAVLPAQAAGTPPAPRDKALQRQLDQLVARSDGPPGVIALLRDGHRTVVYRAGVADTETRRPPNPYDHMRLASVSKAYSGAVALSLVDRRRLRLDETIGERLATLSAAWHHVTLRQLLNHTSGLPDYSRAPEFLKIVIADPHHRFDSRKLLDFVADKVLAFKPGSQYAYSNSDNIAVALMAEAATGLRYERLLERLVYEPLRLRHTSLPQGFRLPGPALHGYDVSPTEPPVDVSELLSGSGVWASGAAVATSNDLTRFIRGYAGGRLLSERTRDQQLRFVPGASEPAGPGTNAAGLAIFRYRTRCGTVYGHTGNTPGYTQLAAATADGKRSPTFSISTQTSKDVRPALLARVRAVQENFVCALLRR